MSKKGKRRINSNEWRKVHMVFKGRKEDRNILMPTMSKVVKKKNKYIVVSSADPKYHDIEDCSELI
mgnify:CR=1 FL=1